MATNLLIGTNRHLAAATRIVPRQTDDPLRPLWNTLCGPRHTHGRLASANTAFYWDLDLGTTATRTYDFLYVPHWATLRYLGAGYVSIESGVSSWSGMTLNVARSSGWPITLYGPRGEDLLWTAEIATWGYGSIPLTTDRRYLRLGLAYANPSALYSCNKFYFGPFFDMGVDPSEAVVSRDYLKPGAFEADSGAWQAVRAEEPRYRAEVVWEGVSDAKVAAFFSEVVEWDRRYGGVLLYTRTDHTVLENVRALHCSVLAATTQQTLNRADCNTVRATFQELL